jgi:hypothetical protein
VPVPQAQISPVEHEEVSVVRPGIKGQRRRCCGQSADCPTSSGVTVDVERVSPVGERVAVQQDVPKRWRRSSRTAQLLNCCFGVLINGA